MGRDVSEEEMRNMAIAGKTALQDRFNEDVAEVSRYEIGQNERRIGEIRRLGLSVGDTGSLKAGGEGYDRLKKMGFGKFADSAIELANLGSTLTGGADSVGVLKKMQGLQGGIADSISNLSLADRSKLAAAMAGSDIGAMAAQAAARERRLAGQMRGGRGIAGALAGNLGLDLSKEEIEVLNQQGSISVAKALAARAGIEDTDFVKGLTATVDASRSGKVGLAADRLAQTIGQSQEAQKKIRERQEDNDPAARATKEMSKAVVDAVKGSQDDIVTALGQVRDKIGEINPEAPKAPK